MQATQVNEVASQVEATEIDTEIDADIEQAVLRIVLDECIAERGPVVSLLTGELSDALGVSPADVLDMASNYARCFWLDGQRFTELRDVVKFARINGDARYVEIDVLKIDQERLAAALLN